MLEVKAQSFLTSMTIQRFKWYCCKSGLPPLCKHQIKLYKEYKQDQTWKKCYFKKVYFSNISPAYRFSFGLKEGNFSRRRIKEIRKFEFAAQFLYKLIH